MEPYTLLEDLAATPIPDRGLVNRTVFEDPALKLVAFGFSQGHVMPMHSSPAATVLQVLHGEAEFTLGEAKKNVRAGAWVHLAPGLPHGILAHTPLVMLLYILKQVRAAESGAPGSGLVSG